MRTLNGRYRLDRRIGVGGMSVVWRGHDMVLGRPVAVKVLGPRLVEGVTHARVRAEAQAAARLAHPNVAAVHDFGYAWRPPLRRVPYIVMELLDGVTLAVHLRRGALPWREAARICAEVAAGLAVAHAHGIVHRDVKPGNVMLTSGGVKLVDFGIAASVDQPEDAAGGRLLGTPAYLAPERLEGCPPVAATDVYGLGLLLYHCLAGRLPWTATDPSEIIGAHVSGRLDPLPPIDGLPREISELCLRCLRRSPHERPDAGTVAAVLAGAVGASLSPAGPPARRRPTPPTVTVPADRATPPAAAEGGRTLRRVRPLVLVGTAVAALFTIAAAGTSGNSSQAGRPVATTPPGQGQAPGGQACTVTYLMRSGAAGQFTATLVMRDAASHPLGAWTLTFALPQGQNLVGVRGALWTQLDRQVTVQGAQAAGAGDTARIELNGTGSGGSAVPAAFALNGATCLQVGPSASAGNHPTVDVRGPVGPAAPAAPGHPSTPTPSRTPPPPPSPTFSPSRTPSPPASSPVPSPSGSAPGTSHPATPRRSSLDWDRGSSMPAVRCPQIRSDRCPGP